ncbi:MAG: hypothetical protein R3C18_22405 [Planctomycetaceae bacterium]
MEQIIAAILAGLCGGAASVWGISKWLGDLWADRIRESLRQEHAIEIERLKQEFAIRLEQTKWPMSREDSLATEFRDALQRVVLPMMSTIHSMCWLTWLVTDDPDQITEERVEAYDKEVHELLPTISGYLTLVATYDIHVFEKLSSHVEKVYALDSDLGSFAHALVRAQRGSNTDVDKYIGRLKKCHDRAVKLEKSIPGEVANLIGNAVARRSQDVVKASGPSA